MTIGIVELFAKWRVAEEAAVTAELKVHEAMSTPRIPRPASPSLADLRAVAELRRAEAEALLQKAMCELHLYASASQGAAQEAPTPVDPALVHAPPQSRH